MGTENRKQAIAAIVLGALLVVIVAYEVMTSFSTDASTALPTTVTAPDAHLKPSRPGSRHGTNSAKKTSVSQDLDPTLHLKQLQAIDQIKYEGSGRNIFVAQADTTIPMPIGNGTANDSTVPNTYVPPSVAPAPPIPLKFFGFASHPGEAKKIFLSKGDDVFIAGEGEIVDRRYKVMRIAPSSVEIQDVVGSGPPQTIPLTQG